jgi:hypothetical protein
MWQKTASALLTVAIGALMLAMQLELVPATGKGHKWALFGIGVLGMIGTALFPSLFKLPVSVPPTAGGPPTIPDDAGRSSSRLQGGFAPVAVQLLLVALTLPLLQAPSCSGDWQKMLIADLAIAGATVEKCGPQILQTVGDAVHNGQDGWMTDIVAGGADAGCVLLAVQTELNGHQPPSLGAAAPARPPAQALGSPPRGPIAAAGGEVSLAAGATCRPAAPGDASPRPGEEKRMRYLVSWIDQGAQMGWIRLKR